MNGLAVYDRCAMNKMGAKDMPAEGTPTGPVTISRITAKLGPECSSRLKDLIREAESALGQQHDFDDGAGHPSLLAWFASPPLHKSIRQLASDVLGATAVYEEALARAAAQGEGGIHDRGRHTTLLRAIDALATHPELHRPGRCAPGLRDKAALARQALDDREAHLAAARRRPIPDAGAEHPVTSTPPAPAPLMDKARRTEALTLLNQACLNPCWPPGEGLEYVRRNDTMHRAPKAIFETESFMLQNGLRSLSVSLGYINGRLIASGHHVRDPATLCSGTNDWKKDYEQGLEYGADDGYISSLPAIALLAAVIEAMVPPEAPVETRSPPGGHGHYRSEDAAFEQDKRI